MALMAVSFKVSPTFGGAIKANNNVQLQTAGRVKLRAMVKVTCEETNKKGGRGSGLAKPRPLSPEMQKFLGVPEIPRPKAIKKIWEYIKENNLQDPKNKKVIVCDESLKSIFDGRERVDFLEVAKLMSPHFLKQ